jgi:outer membrane protein assembly factor BamB
MRKNLILFLLPLAYGQDWPQWRGADMTGKSREKTLVEWSEKDVVWRTPLPEPGNSTPVVSGNRVFVTQARKGEGRRLLLCFDRASGKLLWESGESYTAPEPTHATNPYASASPATDGKLVVAWFGSAGLAAYDLNGRRVWKRDLGIQKHTWGYGSSPVIDGDKVFLNFGPGERTFLAAFAKDTGKTLWQVDMPKGEGKAFSNWNAADMYGSWATPVAVTMGGRRELLVPLPGRLVALDPETGKELWFCRGLGDLVYPSAVYEDGLIVAQSGFGGPAMAVRAGGSGDVTASHRLWVKDKSRSTIGSGVVLEGIWYSVDNGGIAEAVEAKTGKVIWTGRLSGKGGAGAVWSSPVLSNGRLYVLNQSGELFVIKPGEQFELLFSRTLDETSNSSVVIAGGDLFLRTHSALWRIGRR